jgi:hypothetical protein
VPLVGVARLWLFCNYVIFFLLTDHSLLLSAQVSSPFHKIPVLLKHPPPTAMFHSTVATQMLATTTAMLLVLAGVLVDAQEPGMYIIVLVRIVSLFCISNYM